MNNTLKKDSLVNSVYVSANKYIGVLYSSWSCYDQSVKSFYDIIICQDVGTIHRTNFEDSLAWSSNDFVLSPRRCNW